MDHSSGHFKDKSVIEHLREARMRGAIASAELHGTEMSGSVAACADAAKESAVGLLLLWVILSPLLPWNKLWISLVLFSIGWILWKTARSAMIGWSRMERFHRVIEEERWEIEHHRHQEKQELTEMYMAKGLSGPLLDEVIDVLMADDNRLLHIMLEEELGLAMEAHEHPLLQSFGAFCGALLTTFFSLFFLWAFPAWGLPLIAAMILVGSAITASKLEKNRAWNNVIWHLSVTTLIAGTVYFLLPIFS